METNYLKEAFQRLSLVEDNFNLSADKGVIDELRSFVADDIEAVDEEPIIDVEAETENDLKDNYIGKVILECDCCHSRIYKDLTDVILDDDSSLANIEEQCPVCGTESGYNVIGKIEEFNKDAFNKEEEPEELEGEEEVNEFEDDLDDVKDEEEIEDEEDDFEESFKQAFNDVITEGDHCHKHCDDDVECDDEKECDHCDESLNEKMGEDDICPECGENPCKCKKEEVEESLTEAKKRFYADDRGLVDGNINKVIGEIWDDGTVELKKGVKLSDQEKKQAKKDVEKEWIIDFLNEACEEKEELDEAKECCNDKAEEDEEKLEKSPLDESNENLGVKDDVNAGDDEKLEQDDVALAEAPLNEEVEEDLFELRRRMDDASELDNKEDDEIDSMDEACLKEGNPMMDRLRDKMMAMADVDEACEEALDEADEKFPNPDKHEEIGEHNGVKLYHCNDCGKFAAMVDGKKIKKDSEEELKAAIDAKNESLEESKEETLTEEVHEVEVKTDNGDVNIEKDGDKVTVDFAPEGDAPVAEEPAGEEMIAPLNDEEMNQIENNDIEPIEDEEPALGDEEEISNDDLDIDEFDEESFDDMGESFMRKVYENVDNFLTESVKTEDGKLVVEGLITFNSGNKKHTTFVFENAKRTKRGKVVLEGVNTTFTNTAKAFNLKGNLIDKKFVSESMIYNYSTKTLNESNESESVKVYGRVACKK